MCNTPPFTILHAFFQDLRLKKLESLRNSKVSKDISLSNPFF